MSRRRWVLVLLVLGVAGFAARRPVGRTAPSELESARARWERARAAVYGSADGPRVDAKRRLAAAGEALATCPGIDEDERVAVTLRTARELSSLGDERAQTLCQSLVDTTQGQHHVAATLLAGDLWRRAQEWERALHLYDNVIAHAHTSAAERDRASWWSARVLEELERPLEAERALERLALRACDPVRRVHAWDRYARSLHARGEVQRARDAVARCLAELGSFASERSPIGRRVDDALRRMRCRALVTGGT